MNRVSKHKTKGFTPVELMIVIVIMVILAALAAPVFKGYIDRAKQTKYLANCHSLYVATEITLQDWALAGKNPDTLYTISSSTSMDGTAFEELVQSLAQINVGDETYTIKIENHACTEIRVEYDGNEVVFKPDGSFGSVNGSESPITS